MSDFADDLDLARPSAAPRGIEPVGDTPGEPTPRPRLGPTLATVAGERVISPVGGRHGAGKGGKILALLGLVAGCGVFLAATWTHPRSHKAATGSDEPVKQVVDFASVKAQPSTQPLAGPAGAAPPPGPQSGPQSGPPSAAAPTLTAPGVGAPGLTPEGQVVPPIALSGPGGAPVGAQVGALGASGAVAGEPAAPADPRAAAAREAAAQQAARVHAIRAAPLLAYSAGSAPQIGSLPFIPRASARGGEGAADGSELDQLRRGSTIGLVRATRLPDRNFLLSAGAVLPCILETALDSSAPGFVTCRVPTDVYSDSGGVVLMEKGSRVIGEYRSGLSQGRARIFVLWDRITTPGGVAVDVSSPAADGLGRAGFDGRIDSHFWRRFGGALLLTTVQGGLSAAATADARFASVGQAPNEAAAVALQNSINIPPTLTKPQGSEVAIFVSRDLDFSTVYALKGR